MKRNKLLLLAFLLVGFAVHSQVIYQQNFDSFTAGDKLAVVDTEWTTWSNTPGSAEDPAITNAQSATSPNSVVIEGTSDAVLPFPNYTAGHYKVSFNMYVPTGMNGYFNLLQLFSGAASQWGMQVFFDVGGMGSIDGGAQAAATFTYAYNTWMLIENYVDLNTDWAEFYINGTLIHGWVWSSGTFGTGTLKQLGGLNMYAWSENGPCQYYFDDVVFEGVSSALYTDDFESYNVGDFLAVENPTWWETWSNNPGSAEDAPITDAMAHSGTKSVVMQGTSDLILKMGDKTSGEYELSFYYYVPSGFGAYFNIQHYEAPGIQWAYEVYFGAAGNGEMLADGATITFTYPKDQWIFIENMIDLDDDWTKLYIDGALIHEWTFSTVAQGGPGEKQLGAFNLYAGALTGETPRFYMDDITFYGSGGIGNPIINVNPLSLTEALQPGGSSTQNVTIQNTGEQELTYDIFITYDGGPALGAAPGATPKKEVVLNQAVVSPVPTNGGSPDPSDDVILNYDGDNASAIGFTNGGEMKCAAMFPAAMVNPYIGMKLSSMDVYINDPPTSTKLLVYEYGLPNLPGPGQLLLEQPWNFSPGAWNTINLSTPLTVAGGDLWVGYLADHVAGTFPAGTDAGPANVNGRWISSGPGWTQLSFDYNWNIRAKLTGDPVTQWLSVTPASGTVAVGGSQNVTVTFDATGLDHGAYDATVVVNNNDPQNQQVKVEVMLDVITGIIETEKTAVMMYPNPVTDYLHIKSDGKIGQIQLVNLIGQVVYRQYVDENTHSINLSDMNSGVYIIRIDTPNGAVTRKISVD